MTEERWLPVVGWEGLYEVSDQGRVRTVARYVSGRGGGKRLLKQQVRRLSTHPQGYRLITLKAGGRLEQRFVHDLVLTAFTGPRPPGLVTCHGDGDPANNRVENLRWDTQSENLLDAVRHGTHPRAAASECHRGHEFTVENTIVSREGWRSCRICVNESQRRRMKRSERTADGGRRTHCLQGHAYTAENTAVDSRGFKTCRTCQSDRKRERRSRLRAAGLPVN